MAYTRIHAIKATVDKSIAYICNPDKTDGELYVSSFGCSAETAHLEFAFANGKNIKTGENLAHHLMFPVNSVEKSIRNGKPKRMENHGKTSFVGILMRP